MVSQSSGRPSSFGDYSQLWWAHPTIYCMSKCIFEYHQFLVRLTIFWHEPHLDFGGYHGYPITFGMWTSLSSTSNHLFCTPSISHCCRMSSVPLKIVPSPCAIINTLPSDPDLLVDRICSFCGRRQEG